MSRASTQEAAPLPDPPAPPRIWRLVVPLKLQINGQVISVFPGMAFRDEHDDRIIEFIRKANPKALVPIERAATCPKCGTCLAIG